MLFTILPALVSFWASVYLVNLIRHYFRQQFLDIPNDRSSHQQPTPRGGGLGFIIASAGGLLLYYGLSQKSSQMLPIGLWLSLLPLIGVSLLDDWKSLRASVRYTVQLSVSSLIVWQSGGFPQPWLSSLGSFGSILAVLLTVIAITAFINFYNFMDGLDGLVAGVSLIQLSFCALVFHYSELWILVAALLGFLVWNWSPAKIFMGDAGSTLLGAVVAMTLLHSANHILANQTLANFRSIDDIDGIGVVITAWSHLVITLPLLADAIYTLIRRSLRQENIFKAHRTHLYQRLNQAGWPHAQVALLYIGATVLVIACLMLWDNFGAFLGLAGTLITLSQVERYLQGSLLQPTSLSRSAYTPRLISTLSKEPD